MTEKIRVAVIGARGIGKHHAKWHHISGAEVVAFVGTSEETCGQTEGILRGLFDFRGKGYWDMDEMLRSEHPDVVDVCSPATVHKTHVLKALEYGTHVLCEKPLVWDEEKSAEEMLADGREMVAAAQDRGRMLGICTQYAAIRPCYEEIYREHRGTLGRIERFSFTIESKGKAGRKGRAIWVDLGSHPIGALLAWIPEGVVDAERVEGALSADRVVAQFDVLAGSGDRSAVQIVTANAPKGSPPRRHIGLNGFVVDVEGKADEQGIFRTVLHHEGAERWSEDLMHTTIRRFLEAVQEDDEARICATGAVGLRNLELQIEMLEALEKLHPQFGEWGLGRAEGGRNNPKSEIRNPK